jgi:hypothetical protein
VTRDVDDADALTARQRQPREPEVDGHGPGFFLGQPVWIDPGERLHKGRLAVVDVPGRADHKGTHRRHCRDLGIRRSWSRHERRSVTFSAAGKEFSSSVHRKFKFFKPFKPFKPFKLFKPFALRLCNPSPLLSSPGRVPTKKVAGRG